MTQDPTKQGHFQRGGAEYARYRPSYPPELVDALAALAPGCNLAVDVGCGSGQLSALLAERFERVVASDVSESQLANAIAHPRISYRHEAAEAIGIGAGEADLVVAAQAAHWFDLGAFYREVRRVAGEGGVVALISYGVPYLESPLNVWLQRFYWQELHPFWPPERYHVETGYNDLPFPFEPLGMPHLFIRRSWNLHELTGYIRTWSASKRLLEQQREALLLDFEATLAEVWGTPAEQVPIVWPVSFRVGRVAK